MILKKTIDMYRSIGNDGRLIHSCPHISLNSEALSRDKVTKESLAEFGLVEAKRAMGIWGRHHMEAWVMYGTTNYKSSKYNHDPSMILNYESSNYIKYQKL